MPLAPQTRLGAYEIVAPLGAGGMGEVYRARDTRLGRQVAIKVLPSHVGRDAEAVERFRHEAFTLAALNHPNIATIHGFEELPDGMTALVMELVDGETLSERLARRRMETPEALQICAQIAEALEVAHAHGIVHRDIKPGNVIIGPRGLAKVLDFGLARRTRGIDRPVDPPARIPEAPGPAHTMVDSYPASEDAPTVAIVGRPPGLATNMAPMSDAGSENGMTVGTPGYMSPEQVLASPTDARSDVFAFGSVLYECLTGTRAFPGRTVHEIMSATLSVPVNLAALPEDVPRGIRELVARSLERDRNVRPSDMRALRVEIEEALGIRRAAALREGTSYRTPNNLTAQTTSFIGRQGVLRECERTLEGARLVTVLGIGGSGKTRVAQSVAEATLDRHLDGVWIVNLALVTDPDRVPDVAAAALQIQDEPGLSPLEALIRRVGDRTMLFVVDNCEHVLAGAGHLIVRLLAGCPRVRVLATSREPLGIEGETVFPLPTLALPDAEADDAASLMNVESVHLFVERATANDPSFALSVANAGDVVEICRRLDGIPLALELAAARVRMLGVTEIRARLGNRFKLLARHGSGGPTRQQTLQATIQWSWDHLRPPERDLMRRLAVFSGGWTLYRATTVLAEDHDEFEVLDLLTRLVDRALVVVERSASTPIRYRFLESIHYFALEKLQSHPEHAELRNRHLDAYLALARSASKAMIGAGMAQQIAELVPEEENVLAALAWCEHAPDGARRGLVLVEQFSRFWTLLGRYATGTRAFDEALRRDAANPPSPERAKALTRASGFALSRGEVEAARVLLEESLAFWRSSPEPTGLPAVVAGLGVVAMYQCRYEDALRLGEESLALYEQRGQRRGVAMALHNLGSIEFVLSRPDHGRKRLEQALGLLREVGDLSTQAICLSALSTARLRCGDRQAAHDVMRECLDVLEKHESPREGVYALEALAELLFAHGRPIDAARALGAAERAREQHRLPLLPAERVDVERLSARLPEDAGTRAFEEAMTEGRHMTLSAALAEGRRVMGVVGRSP